MTKDEAKQGYIDYLVKITAQTFNDQGNFHYWLIPRNLLIDEDNENDDEYDEGEAKAYTKSVSRPQDNFDYE